jgi:hypothetical protein
MVGFVEFAVAYGSYSTGGLCTGRVVFEAVRCCVCLCCSVDRDGVRCILQFGRSEQGNRWIALSSGLTGLLRWGRRVA